MKVAIYSRKSVFTGKGESIENQVEMCKEYYARMKDINNVDFVVYEDEGFSGGNINRPNFQKMLKDIKKNEFSALICYRLDRISRNVADFSNTLELLQKHDVDFISIREQFDTSTPMGRAMVYISSVFAQLERETIAERIKDNMLELSKTGRWLGGQTPLGFESEKISYIDNEFKERSLYKLKPLEKELNIVKIIFSEYLSKGSIHMVRKELLNNYIKGKKGGEFGQSTIADILRNPVYVISDNNILEYYTNLGTTFCGEPNGNGLLIYNKRTSTSGRKYKNHSEWIVSVSRHKGIISSDDFIRVQNMLKSNSSKQNPRQGTSNKALLSSVLKCAICGAPMRISYGRVRKDGLRTYYYMCTMKAHSAKKRCDNPNAIGPELEKEILQELMNYNEDVLKRKFIEYSDLIKKADASEDIDSINNNIRNIKKETNNLINQLSKCTNEITQKLLLDKIDEQSNQIKTLENKKLIINDKVSLDNSVMENMQLVISSFSEFNKLYSTVKDLDFIEDETITIALRNLIKRMVTSITYNGYTKEVLIDIWGDKKKTIENMANNGYVSQFCSASTCYSLRC